MRVAAETHRRRPYQFLIWPGQVFDVLRRYPILATSILVLLAITAVFASNLAPHDPNAADLRARDIPPLWLDQGTWSHPFGTDQLGRDVLSRLMHGSRVSLMVAVIGVTVGAVAGTISGLVAGYFGGLVDEIIMRLVDLWSAIPFILLGLVVAVTIGSGLTTVIWLLALLSWSTGARNIRGEVLTIKTLDYVALARVADASNTRIIYRHIFPQVVPVVIVITTLRTGSLIIAEAGLSFLGVGVSSSTPTWGLMVAEGRQFLLTSWWISIFPGVAIFLTVMALNFLGDWLRDFLDPRLRQLDH